MTFTGERRVGIGTNNPGARLTISQSTDADNNGFRIMNMTGQHSGRLWMNGGDFHIQKGDDPEDGFIIKANDRIGAFTDNPQARLHIYEGISGSDNLLLISRQKLVDGAVLAWRVLEAKEDGNTYIRKLGVYEDTPTDILHVNTPSNSENPFRVQVAGSTKLRVVADGGGTSIGSNNANPPDNGLYIHGNLHIGTTLGASGYKVAVNGKVICEELRVQLSSEWPDYVFSEQFNLTELDELRQYISKHRHLPGIPNADVMSNNGIAVSEMVITLVQKIEELTLYILAQDQRIKSLEKHQVTERNEKRCIQLLKSYTKASSDNK
jgi:hypothetical protein